MNIIMKLHFPYCHRNKRYHNKRTKTWSVYTVKTAKDYNYIPDLQKAILGVRLRSKKGLPRRRTLGESDPRRRGTLAEIPPPPTAELAQAQLRRGEVFTHKTHTIQWGSGVEVYIPHNSSSNFWKKLNQDISSTFCNLRPTSDWCNISKNGLPK